jgi:integrase
MLPCFNLPRDNISCANCALFRRKETHLKRVAKTKLKGSVVFNKLRASWNYLWCEAGKRRSVKLGSLTDLPTKEDALAEAERRLRQKRTVITLSHLVESYRGDEKMPSRASTKRVYEFWLTNYILPQWADRPITDVQARPVELWLRRLTIAPKSKAHIRSLLQILWDYAMWLEEVPTKRNPMSLVAIKGVTKRVRQPRSLSVHEFQLFVNQFDDNLRFRVLVLVAVSFGLRISEALGLKWQDVDWLRKRVHIERGVVRQIVDDVKSSHSAKAMVAADELLNLLKLWRQATEFSAEADWIFASPWKIGRQPIGYTFVWETLNAAAVKAGIGHLSSHTFRHTYRTWLDSVGTPVGVQQKLMRHADIRTTMNIYGDAVSEDMVEAHEKVVRLAMNAGTESGQN